LQRLKQSDQLRFGDVWRLFNPPKRCNDFFGRRPEHGRTAKRMDSQTSPHPTMETFIGARFAHQFRCPNLTSMGDFLLELIICNHSSHKCDPPSRCRSTSISNARASSMSSKSRRKSDLHTTRPEVKSIIHNHIVTNKHPGAKLTPLTMQK